MTPQQKGISSGASELDDGNARIVTPSHLAACGERLRAGELVAFPTETVYGLGCHALDPSAVLKVFAAKERPLTDPLIVHVASVEDALKLWKPSADTIRILKTICDEFWPGPLTLVAKAAPQVPSILMANTGYVACRFPLHPLAQALIKEAEVPIAAPSANKFGHVSPTQAHHVMDDLGKENVWILQQHDIDSILDNNNKQSIITCHVGVESTVAKLEVDVQSGSHPYVLTVLRQGAVAVQDLQICLSKAGLKDVLVTSLSSRTVDEAEATVAPGQTIKHYSPRIPSYLMARSLFDAEESDATSFLRQAIVLDFGRRLASWKGIARQYRDLSPSGDSREAAQCVFEALRWAEQIDSVAICIVFPQVIHDTRITSDALTLALHDRLTRAASGVVLESLADIQQRLSTDDHNA